MRFGPVLLTCLLLLASCRSAGTYTERGEHIELMKGILEDFGAAEWYAYGNAYADSARIFVNSTTPMTLEERMASHQALRVVFEEVAIVNPIFGEVNNTDGETWVLTWGSWVGRVVESEAIVSVPIHMASRFEAGKIVQEWVYVDLSPLEEAVMTSRTILETPVDSMAVPVDSMAVPDETMTAEADTSDQ